MASSSAGRCATSPPSTTSTPATTSCCPWPPRPTRRTEGMAHPVRFGLDRLLADPALRRPLAGKRVALLAHPASVTRELTHSLDALAVLPDLTLSAAFGPQHGLRGDKQDNM